LAAAVGKRHICCLLAAIIEAIFTVCGQAMIEHRQCPLSLEKWEELVIGPVQTILGLTIDTNSMTVGITPDYRQQVLAFLQKTGLILDAFSRFETFKSVLGKLHV
jgi:hypothetical protein